MFHPTTEQLHDSILECFHATISRFPPLHASGTLPPSALPYRLGDYLVDLGYLLPHQLARVLTRAWHQYANPPVPLGCILAARDMVPIPVLATILVLQGLDRLEHIPAFAPRLFSEQLLVAGYLSPEQLALVLEEQLLDYQHGQWNRLGSLILGHGWLDPATLVEQVECQGNCN